MQIHKTYYKNLSFESGGKQKGGRWTARERVPSLNRKAGQKEDEGKKSKMGKNYGGPIPWVILTKRGKLKILKAPQ